MGDLNAIEAVQEKLNAAEDEFTQADNALARATTDAERLTVRDRVGTAREKVALATATLAKLPVRLVAMLEHRKILERALVETKHRLLINSPWMTSAVVTFEFQRDLERRLRGGVKVYIAYGISEDGGKKKPKRNEIEAESALQNLARGYANLRLTRLGDTHAKVLISDSAYAVVTSFNWLSFRGDPNKTFRDERGVMIMIPSLVDAQFNEILARMNVADARPRPKAPPSGAVANSSDLEKGRS